MDFVRDIKRKIYLRKFTMGKIKKKMDTDKENNLDGHFSILITHIILVS